MGTNYYLRSEPCSACGLSPDPKHIGKSSAGWCFSLHVEPENGIATLEDWQREWSKTGKEIRDEYGRAITPSAMLDTIKNRSRKRQSHPRHFLDSNFAEEGSNGLLRHRIEPNRCVGHGEGPWDYCVGEFS